jgi:hypothetical protein
MFPIAHSRVTRNGVNADVSFAIWARRPQGASRRDRQQGKPPARGVDHRPGRFIFKVMLRRFRILSLLLGLAGLSMPAAAKVEIHVDLGRQRMTVVKNHEKPIVWKISSGRAGYETPTGSFIVQRMDAEHLSDEYDQAPMPYAIFFSRGLAIHGTYERGLGRPASHGCVRLSIDNARDLYDWVEQYGASIEIAGDAPAFREVSDEDRKPPRRETMRNRSREIGEPLFFQYDSIFRSR